MNIKRMLLIGLILVAVAASLSIVSADSSVKVGEFNFNIPDGYDENKSVAMDHVNGSYNTIGGGEVPCTMAMKGFDKGKDTIGIMVFEFDSPDDAKKAQDYDKELANGTAKTINGHDGVYFETNGVYAFHYCKDKYYISVETSESLLEKVVPK